MIVDILTKVTGGLLKSVNGKKGNVYKQLTEKDLIIEAIRRENEQLRKTADDREWGLKKTNDGIKTLYKELEKKNKELKKLDELKSEFVSTVSHELRTPLAITTEGLNLVIEEIPGTINEKQKNLLVTSKRNIERLTAIINDLLDISKIEVGRMELKRKFVDMKGLFEDLLDSYQRVVSAQKIKLVTNLPERKIFLYLDGDKIIQVMNNLLNNAVKFTKEDGIVAVEMMERESNILCSVKDTGGGISEENMNRLFNKFEQFGRIEGPGKRGTGLGLSISKALIELHGGKIWAESRLGEGTTFSFLLPKYDVVNPEGEDYLKDILQDSAFQNTQSALIIIDLCNFNDVISDYGECVLYDMMNNVFSIISRNTSRVDYKVFICDIHTVYGILPDTKRAGVALLIGRIRKAIRDHKFIYENNTIEPVIKIGYAVYPLDGNNKDKLIKVARENLQRQKIILIVDDHPEIVGILQMRLESKGFRTRCAYNGVEALKSIEGQVPDLILLDITMPVMNGYEVSGRLRENPDTAHIPIVMLTGQNVDNGGFDSSISQHLPVLQKTDGFENVVDVINNLL